MSEYSDIELLERLRNFDSDSVYEVTLVHEAAERIAQLLEEVRDLNEERSDILDHYPRGDW